MSEEKYTLLDWMDSFMFQGYKSYQGLSAEPHILEHLQNVNVLIGKNNSGKSSIMELMEACFRTYLKPSVAYLGVRASKKEEVWKRLQSNEIQKRNTRYRYIDPASDLSSYDKFSLVNIDFSINFQTVYERKSTSLRCQSQRQDSWITQYADRVANELDDFKLLRLAADRDIVPEIQSDSSVLESNGRGATNLIRRFLLNEKHNPNLINSTLLKALNQIMGSDGQFSSIQVLEREAKDNDQHLWEICLEENSRIGRFPLSACGSGLKTIILMLLNLLVAPSLVYTNSGHPAPVFFAFEELENNLHPAVQRRLFQFIYDYSLETGHVVFITTHSNIAINAFYGKKNTAFYQITRDEAGSHISRIDDTSSVLSGLRDLGVQASDILQTNGVIWVEGPSDRIYIERWLKIYQKSPNVDILYEEGVHYHYLYYGGRCLSHYSGALECQAQDLIQIFKINTNAIIVMDSDIIANKKEEINSTKKRVAQEFQNSSSLVWITAGKEIENYVDSKLWEEKLGTSEPLGQYDCFTDYYKQVPKYKSATKVDLAREIVEHITADNWEQYDLKEWIAEIYQQIHRWNA